MSNEPVIEFPCRYPVKIIVATGSDHTSEVIEIVRRHCPKVSPDDIGSRHSQERNLFLCGLICGPKAKITCEASMMSYWRTTQ